MLARYAKVLLKSVFTKGVVKATVAIDFMCNARCKTCNVWRHHDPGFKFEDLERALDYDKFVWLTITGGEPFLRDDVWRFIKLFFETQKSLLAVNIDTNGILTNKILEQVRRMLQYMPDHGNIVVAVSIHGDKKINDSFFGVPAYEKIVKTIRELKKLEEETQGKVAVALSSMISPYNSGGAEWIVKNSEKLFGIKRNRIFHPVPIQAINFDTFTGVRYEYDKMPDELERVRRMSWIYNRIYLNVAKKSVEKDGYAHTLLPCYAAKKFIYINYDLKVHPCNTLPDVIGDLREETLSEVVKRAVKMDYTSCRKCLCNTSFLSSLSTPRNLLKSLKYLL